LAVSDGAHLPNLPAVISTTAIFIAIFFTTGYALTAREEFSPTNLVLNFLVVRPTIDSVVWSLQLELIAAPMLLLIYFAWQRFGARAALLPYALLLILSFTSVWNHLIGPPFSFGQRFVTADAPGCCCDIGTPASHWNKSPS
jgi:hypothetical protein